MAKAETDILNRWRLKWNKWGILFRNNVGAAWAGVTVREWTQDGEKYITLKGAYRIPFGLIKGSGDFVGWRTMIITPDMVGKPVAVFASVEGKTEGGVLSDDQKRWLLNVRRAGGIAFVVRSEDTVPSGWGE